MKKICFHIFQSRSLWLLFALFVSIQMFAVGFTPTDCGLVVNLKTGDRILLSTMVDDDNNPATPAKEYFVCHYNGYTGGIYNYKAGNTLKLIPQAAGASVPSEVSVWTIDEPLTRVKGSDNYALGGISYTMWSSTGFTLQTSDGFKYTGNLSNKTTEERLCDVVFVIPTDHSGITSLDPNNTMGRGTTFNGETGVGFAGMVYREVFFMDIPRFNIPITYTNAAVLGFNTSFDALPYSDNQVTAIPGQALYSFADNKHKATPRTLFRLYILNEPLQSCPDSYFFAYDEQDYLKYRTGPHADAKPRPLTWQDSTALKKTYTMDRLFCMEQEGETSVYRTGMMRVPESDSAYFYVGNRNTYCNAGGSVPLGTNGAVSQFTKMRELRVDDLKDADRTFAPAGGAMGQMIVDASSGANNLGVTFKPAGYFMRTSTGRNIEMTPNGDSTEWIATELWTITEEYANLSIKTTLYTGEHYSDDDPGADIIGWSEYVRGTDIKTVDGDSVVGKSGWARIRTNTTDVNGGMVFVTAAPDRWVHYDYNNFIGAALPDQYPPVGENWVTVREARLLSGFTFIGWNTRADGKGDTIMAGERLDLSAGQTTLYAMATFDANLQIAISFMQDGKRYFLTHPNSSAPRFARARHFDDWTEVRQGMSDADNSNPNYLSTFAMVDGCLMCDPNDRGLDPIRDTMYVGQDSLIFYEDFTPHGNEYIGLYYVKPWNTIISNNSWAGMFNTSAGEWPTYLKPSIDHTYLFSERYVEFVTPSFPDHPAPIDLYTRDTLPSYVQYNPLTKQFDGVNEDENPTDFQLSAVAVADAHYVILPDTTVEWLDEIVFDYHENEQIQHEVWSKLIGKQLMAMMIIAGDTIYFHPNPRKVITTADALRLSNDYRLTESFTYIRDARVESMATVGEENKPQMSETSDDFSRMVTSGMSSPLDVIYQGKYIDIEDTIRIDVDPFGSSRIKGYYGRWKERADGLKMDADGTRHRDIIVRTKTYHYGATTTKLVLKAAQESYNFSPLANQSLTLGFTLDKVTSRPLLDAQGNVVSEEVYESVPVTSQLTLGPSYCSLQSNSVFDITGVLGQNVTIKTKYDNDNPGIRTDTLQIRNLTVTIDGVGYPVSCKVPLVQPPLEGNELVWSAEYDGKRYFIMAGQVDGRDTLIYRQFTSRSNILYQKDTWNQLIKGSANAANSNARYITPWEYYYVDNNPSSQQLMLKTEYGIGRWFTINGGTIFGTTNDEKLASVLTYHYANVYVNDNSNFEEQVRLQFGADKWVTFTLKDGAPQLGLQSDSASATVFSWAYLQPEYNLLNNGDYPDRDYAEFGYNDASSVSFQTRYKAYSEYTMLINNQMTYCSRVERTNYTDLSNAEWKTRLDFNLIPDSRFEDTGYESGLAIEPNSTTMTTTVTASGASPVMTSEPYMNIVDTLEVVLSLQDGAPAYRYQGNWQSIEDAHLKLPLVRKTYHEVPYDSVVCVVGNDEYNYSFPAFIEEGESISHTFTLGTVRRKGTNVLDVENHVVASRANVEDDDDLTDDMDLTDRGKSEIRLIDEFGNKPLWCAITGITENTVTVTCTQNGIRSPRSAMLYFAYVVNDGTESRYVNFRLTVSQPSFYQYSNTQTLIHTKGASGDEMTADGRQQVHENKRILYYYPEQDVELPIRERAFYGWWRWYRAEETRDSDIPDEHWRMPPRNVGKYNYPFRIIGDSVDDGEGGKMLVTMGRYTVFHYPSREYGSKADPPSKNPRVVPPTEWNGGEKTVITYAVDMSNYFDHLPLSMKEVNQIDTAKLDTMSDIIEPTLSLREVFELHPWTEMGAIMENYKTAVRVDETYPLADEKYMEDHVVMAPTGNRLLLKTEQRYNYANLAKGGHSESLLGYYMRDDNWDEWSDDPARQDSMLWVAGWDADVKWYTYNTRTKKYTVSQHPITEGDDFLNVPAKTSITAGQEADTVYYCLRSRSVATTGTKASGYTDDEPADGNYWFNICRYKVIYHRPAKYGPLQETTTGGVTKALLTKEEIEQNYEVLERLNFDYNHPGSDYQVYPHPLPWGDASYGYSYPESDEVPNNRYHNDFAPNFPNVGEYGLINRIPYTNYWHKMEQHGGAEKGYMIYCDGMSSAGQVAALTLKTHLCEGQRMYFSGFVGNPSNQNNKSKPNFLFSVQGSKNGTDWTDITSYMTGDINPSDKWYQIFFPIRQEGDYDHYRVRVLNMASSFDGNDFIIDDMCIFATKPPLVAYQANTTCMQTGENDSLTHVVVRVDYQGFNDSSYNNVPMYYTVEKIKDGDTTFIEMEDGYFNQIKIDATPADTVLGWIQMPSRHYNPMHEDSVFSNLSVLVEKFETTLSDPGVELFRQGYIYENLDGSVRPVMYVIHKAKMTADNQYKVRMSGSKDDLLNSICAMTSNLKVSNRMTLELNGEEQDMKEIVGMCANTTYDISLRIKGSLFRDSIAPVDLNGSCMDDWLLYGDTSAVTSVATYGHKYSDIVAVITQILRCAPGGTTNANQFARNLSEVSSAEMRRIQANEKVTLSEGEDAYTLLSDLVNNGFLTMFRSKITATATYGDSLQYVIFPIIGTGSDAMLDLDVEVCPTPIFVKLKPTKGGDVPMTIGGFKRDVAQLKEPAVVIADEAAANREIVIPIDSLMSSVAIGSISLLSTNDPEYLTDIHTLNLMPDRILDPTGENIGYYKSGDNLVLSPADGNTYRMRPGFSYTFGIEMTTLTGNPVMEESGCRVGTVPFTLAVVPNHLRWDPKSPDNNQWNNPDNWIGINQHNEPIHADAHFVPLASTCVVIPVLAEGLPYPVLPDPESLSSQDSVKQTGFQYNSCDTIRFMPGTAMGQQQYLTHNKAVVDMSLPQNKWAFRAAPVTGMLSGDVYMSNADLTWRTSPWEVGEFDANGRNYTTGNASFWLSLYNRSEVSHRGNTSDKDSAYTVEAEWTRVTNGMSYSLPPATGWAVFARTAAGKDDPAAPNLSIRLPKNDDIYYYYTADGQKSQDTYEMGLRAKRNTYAGGVAGELAYRPEDGYAQYRLTNAVASTTFVFGNPTMGYIDIWGFIADNGLIEKFNYMSAAGVYTSVTKAGAEKTEDIISNPERYLPPMHAIELSVAEGAALDLRLYPYRVVTSPSQVVRSSSPSSAPRRAMATGGTSKGIMTITAVNPVSSRCVSRLLLGQGYHAAVQEGEDAVLTTINIDHYSTTSAPATPFNIYASEGKYGLSVNLRDEIVNVPISFYMSELPYDPVTYLWFTGVTNIDGELVLYDALMDSERTIRDGIRLEIETPVISHQTRYYIRRRGYAPGESSTTPVATSVDNTNQEKTPAIKRIRNGHVLIIRDGHVYTMFGQKIQ